MPTIKIKNPDGTWKYVNEPSSNADTLDGKYADEFASASDVEALQTKVGDTSVSEQINTALENHEVSWNELTEKPFGEEINVITLIDNHTFNFEMNENGDNYFDTSVVSDNVTPFEAGKFYHVIHKDSSGNIGFDGIVEGYENSLSLYNILTGLTVYSREDSYEILIPAIFGYPEGIITIEYIESNLTQLDSKFIGDDIARVEDIPSTEGLATEEYVNNKIPTLTVTDDGAGNVTISFGG